MAMGGTGVASASLSAAAFFNPALLAMPEGKDHIGVELLGISVHAADGNNYHDDYNNTKNLVNNVFPQAVNDYNAAVANPSSQSATVLANDVRNMSSGVQGLSGHDFILAPDVMPVSVAVHNPLLSFGVFTNVEADIAGRFNYSGKDQSTLNNYVAVLNQIGGGNLTTAEATLLNNPNLLNPNASGCGGAHPTNQSVLSCLNNPQNTVTSSVEMVGLQMSEVGVALAEQWNGWAFGVTPKVQGIRTFNYAQYVRSNQTFSLSDVSKTYTTINFDAGAAYQLPLFIPVKLGASVRNLIPQNFDTVTNGVGNSYRVQVRPQVTAGGEAHVGPFTVTGDLDVLENHAPVSWGSNTQFLGLGAELNAWILKLRAGYRQNLIGGPLRNELTAGVALGPLDVSASYSSYSAGIMAGLSMNF